MWYKCEGDLKTLIIYAQPGAKVTEIAGVYQNALKIRLKAPPIEGRANAMLQKFLASLFEVPLKQVKLIHGENYRRKVFEIVGSIVNPDF